MMCLNHSIGRPKAAVWLVLMAVLICQVPASFLLAASAAVEGQSSGTSAPSATSRDGSDDDRRPSSPLHDLLGIDPETGAFAPPRRRPRPDAAPSSPSDDTPQSTAGEATTATALHRGPSEELAEVADEAAVAIERLTEQLDEGSLDDLSALVGGRLDADHLMQMQRRFLWLSVGLLMIYPLGIVVSEVFSFYVRRDQAELTDLDRRYQRTRLVRRLLLAGALAMLVAIVAVGSANFYWWNRPDLFTVFCLCVALLSIIAAALWTLIRQAARDYTLTMMRDMRRHQLEIRADLDELRKRLRQVTMTGE